MDRRRMNDLREVIGMQFSLTRSRMMWAGHLVWMEEDRSLGADGGGQVTWCGWRRAGHVVRMEEGRSLGVDGGGQVTWCG